MLDRFNLFYIHFFLTNYDFLVQTQKTYLDTNQIWNKSIWLYFCRDFLEEFISLNIGGLETSKKWRQILVESDLIFPYLQESSVSQP